MTESVRRALEIIREYPSISPRDFARKMWPDSPGWERRTKCGNYGVTAGGGMNLAGGAYLGKLRAAGWITTSYPDGGICHRLTIKALELL